MDSLSDREVEGIWERTKKYINVSNIKASDIRGLTEEIEREMRGAREALNKAGSIETLIDKGFPRRAAEVLDIRRGISGVVTPIEKIIRPRKRAKVKRLPERVSRKPKGMLAITTGKGIRRHSARNIKITRGKWKGRNAYWVFNTRLKKLVTWGTS